MKISPRNVAVLALLAYLPVGIYVFAAGEMTVPTTAIAVVNLVLIAGSILLMFGPSPDQPTAATH
jgi:uncharacterized membrane protein